MAATSPPTRSLHGEFAHARTLYSALDDSPLASSHPTYQQQVLEALDTLARCASLVRQLGVFSRNETVEDVNTADLRYLLVDAYTAEIMTKRMDADRDATLTQAAKLYEAFLATCEHMEILSKEDKLYLDNHIRSTAPDAVDVGVVTTATSARMDPDRRRLEKISRFKREKATRIKLKDLHAQIAHRPKPTPSDAHEHNDNDMDDDDPDFPTADEDLTRSLTLTTIDLFIQKALDSLKLIHDERSLLASHRLHLANNPTLTPHRDSPKDTGSTRLDSRVPKPTAYTGPLLAEDGHILRPFVITPAKKDRAQIAKGVFGYGHNLPTMSVDTYLQQEMERGNFLSGGGKQPEKPVMDDNDNDAADAETYKAREWDEFKDYNPAGWGNRHNKG
ncbi:hypothetical protein PhCBS80983_g01316 [Powellomyces hirtus]|uniref:TAP42-like protein n=1 Tax=Powellomyces hirtus TaxID=109895 RepID=A0A507EDB4_9FUNG|nr:hypothetical protein PhCBS80983_g01316 [Powellomyces hirtus]